MQRLVCRSATHDAHRVEVTSKQLCVDANRFVKLVRRFPFGLQHVVCIFLCPVAAGLEQLVEQSSGGLCVDWLLDVCMCFVHHRGRGETTDGRRSITSLTHGNSCVAGLNWGTAVQCFCSSCFSFCVYTACTWRRTLLYCHYVQLVYSMNNSGF